MLKPITAPDVVLVQQHVYLIIEAVPTGAVRRKVGPTGVSGLSGDDGKCHAEAAIEAVSTFFVVYDFEHCQLKIGNGAGFQIHLFKGGGIALGQFLVIGHTLSRNLGQTEADERTGIEVYHGHG